MITLPNNKFFVIFFVPFVLGALTVFGVPNGTETVSGDGSTTATAYANVSSGAINYINMILILY